jgi:hypothetical protein
MSSGERYTLLVGGVVFAACIATLGGLYLMRDSAVDGDSVVAGVLDASWTAPTTNTDGSSLTDVASYRVYYSTTAPPCPSGHVLTVASSSARPAPHQTVSVRLTGLTMGQLYYVAVTAVNSRGVQSGCSITASARARRP